MKKAELEEVANSKFLSLGLAILVQSWIAGLFLGKITTGSYSGGFMYSIFLVVISIGAIAIISLGIFNVAAIYS
jgi:flagellar protein FlaJ